MTVLALDCTSEFGGLAVRSQGETRAEVAIRSPEGFGHVLFGALDDLLRQAALSLTDIDCFAAASGPGSFTGVRVGLAAVKGLAAATGKPAVGVSNLQALAWFGTLPAPALRAVVIDARRGEVYAAVYDAALHPVLPECVSKLPAWLASLADAEYQFISPLGPAILEGSRFAGMPLLTPPRSLARVVAACAERAPRLDPVTLDANYVRRSDAELFLRNS